MMHDFRFRLGSQLLLRLDTNDFFFSLLRSLYTLRRFYHFFSSSSLYLYLPARLLESFDDDDETMTTTMMTPRVCAEESTRVFEIAGAVGEGPKEGDADNDCDSLSREDDLSRDDRKRGGIT